MPRGGVVVAKPAQSNVDYSDGSDPYASAPSACSLLAPWARWPFFSDALPAVTMPGAKLYSIATLVGLAAGMFVAVGHHGRRLGV